MLKKTVDNSVGLTSVILLMLAIWLPSLIAFFSNRSNAVHLQLVGSFKEERQ